jgi:hypothetical protein
MKKTISGLVAVAVLGSAALASATINMQKQAKTAGVEVKACTHCHVDKLPKKGAAAVNDVGKWLVEQKTKKGAKEADGAWLKDYKPAK